jgi:hypothetical protein
LENTRQYNVLIIFLGVDFSHYPLNSRIAFLRFFVIMKQNGYNDRMKWYKLTGIGASRDVEFRSTKHLSNFFLSYLKQCEMVSTLFSIAKDILNDGPYNI